MEEPLEYLTIESLSWSKGYQRPRMDVDARRERHRLVQRRLVERKRERMDELYGTIRLLELQIKWLHAARKARDHARENHALRLRLQGLITSVEPLPYNGVDPHDHDRDVDDLLIMASILEGTEGCAV